MVDDWNDKTEAEKRRAHQVGLLTLYLIMTVFAALAIMWIEIVRFVIALFAG